MRNTCMARKFIYLLTAIGLASVSVVQAQSTRSRSVPSAPSPSAVSPVEEATNPQAAGGGHGQVWVNTEIGVYHREGSVFYGTTRKGKYMTEQDAKQAGYKPAPKTR
jgi:hypothetical protein